LVGVTMTEDVVGTVELPALEDPLNVRDPLDWGGPESGSGSNTRRRPAVGHRRRSGPHYSVVGDGTTAGRCGLRPTSLLTRAAASGWHPHQRGIEKRRSLLMSSRSARESSMNPTKSQDFCHQCRRYRDILVEGKSVEWICPHHHRCDGRRTVSDHLGAESRRGASSR